MDAGTWVMLVCLAFVALVGTILNALTTYVLLRNKTLSKKLSSVRWLMCGESLCETLVCGIGVPISFVNLLVGEQVFFTNQRFLCHLNVLAAYGAGYVALWYQALIATTRLVAVFAPYWYRHYAKTSAVMACLLVFPWCVGFGVFLFGAAAKAFEIRQTPGTGTCAENPYDDSPDAESRFGAYLLTDSLLHTWIPLVLGLACYALIYAKKLLEKLFGSKTMMKSFDTGKVGPVSTAWTMDSLHGTTKPAAEINKAELAQKHQQKRARDRRLRLLAIAYVVNYCLVFPNNAIAWGLNYYTYLSENMPWLASTLDVMGFLAFPINPLIYLIVSADFRQAFRQLFGYD